MRAVRYLKNLLPLAVGVGLPGLLSLVGCEPPPPPPPPPTPEEYRADVEAWQERRVQQLREPDSWLSIVDLHWMMPGDTHIGSDPRMDLILPGEDVLPWVGTLTLRGQGSFEYSLSPDAIREMGEEAPNPFRFRVDADAVPPIMRWGTLSWFVIERFGEYGIRVRDSDSEALANFEGLETFPIDLEWRVMARFDRYDPPRDIPMPNVLDVPSTSTSPGAAVFEVDGEEYRLDVTGEPGARRFFLVFADGTTGFESYPGGRFLSVEAPNEDGWMVLDFNRAYNPPCVFTPYATCPVPPPQNNLTLRIEAGEKMYYGTGHEPVGH